jgi:hypothetical protein
LDFEDQQLLRSWLHAEPTDEPESQPDSRARRFDSGLLVDDELVSHFVDRTFLDPEDDRVLEEILARPLGGASGLTVGDLIDRETLRDKLRARNAPDQDGPTSIPVTPQRRRRTARSRLRERTGSVVARILADLDLSRQGRDVARAVRTPGPPASNVQIVTRLLNMEINEQLGIGPGERGTLSAAEAEAALASLDEFGDSVRDRIEASILGR